jgi:hypothetical protein
MLVTKIGKGVLIASAVSKPAAVARRASLHYKGCAPA